MNSSVTILDAEPDAWLRRDCNGGITFNDARALSVHFREIVSLHFVAVWLPPNFHHSAAGCRVGCGIRPVDGLLARKATVMSYS